MYDCSGKRVWVAGHRGMVGSALVRRLSAYPREILCDESNPDGTPRTPMAADTLRAMGWSLRIALIDGIRSTYAWFLDHRA